MNIKKISNKGFTLIELLATILIIGLVLGLTAYGIISVVNSSKDKGIILSIKGIKEAARTYSGEYSDDEWKSSNTSNNIYFCTTIEELINKGLLDNKAKSVEDDNIKLTNYVAVIKDKNTKVVRKELILTKNYSEDEDADSLEAYMYCTGNIKSEEIRKYPTLKNKKSYTDTISTEFTNAEFVTKTEQNFGIKEIKCGYGEDTNNFKWSTDDNAGEIVVEDNTCEITSLNQNKMYYVKVCMSSENGSQACSDAEGISTKKVKQPTININTVNSIKISYDNSNIKGESYYYFKSTMSATTKNSINSCSLTNNNYVCSNTNETNIEVNTWYKSNDKEIALTYVENGDISITAVTKDKSNNSNSSNNEYSLYKTKFIREPADKIDNQINDIERYCLANKGDSCSIISPTIEKSNYDIIGWNTSSSATSSNWKANTSKKINKSETYYPIVELNTYTITYDNNGGSGCKNTTVKKGSQIGSLCVPKKTGYVFIGWFDEDYKDVPLNYYADTYNDLKQAFGYNSDNLYNHYLTYGKKENRRIAQYLSTDIYEKSSNITIYAGWKVNSYKLNITKNAGVNTIYYKTTGGWLSSTSDVSIDIPYGTDYSYYGESKKGYTMQSTCNSSSNICKGVMGTSTVIKKLTASDITPPTITYYLTYNGTKLVQNIQTYDGAEQYISYNDTANDNLAWLGYNGKIHYSISDDGSGLDSNTSVTITRNRTGNKELYETDASVSTIDYKVSSNGVLNIDVDPTFEENGTSYVNGYRVISISVKDKAGNKTTRKIYFRVDTSEVSINRVGKSDGNNTFTCSNSLSGVKRLFATGTSDNIVYEAKDGSIDYWLKTSELGTVYLTCSTNAVAFQASKEKGYEPNDIVHVTYNGTYSYAPKSINYEYTCCKWSCMKQGLDSGKFRYTAVLNGSVCNNNPDSSHCAFYASYACGGSESCPNGYADGSVGCYNFNTYKVY